MPKIQFFLVVLILGFLTGPRVMQALQKKSTDVEINSLSTIIPIDTLRSTKPDTIVASSSYTVLPLLGRSIYVWDSRDHRKLFGTNEREYLPLASVTKMMTALVASETLADNARITINTHDIALEGDSGFYPGEEWGFRDLLNYTLVTSSNDGASAIANAAGAVLIGNASSTDSIINKKAFVAKMNEKAKAIGLEKTIFLNESGLDADDKTSGAYGTARDMAILTDYIFQKNPTLLSSTARGKIKVSSKNNVVYQAMNTNPGVEHIKGILGSKTGFTDLAGGNLVVTVDMGNSHPVIIAVLGSTREGRFSDVDMLLEATAKEIATRVIQ